MSAGQRNSAISAREDTDQRLHITQVGPHRVVVEVDIRVTGRIAGRLAIADTTGKDAEEVSDVERIGQQHVAVEVDGIAEAFVAPPGKDGRGLAIHGVESNVDLDHVLVGPNGVTIIECETRQRSIAKEAQRDHEVAFDGKTIMWPSGADRDTVAAIENETVSFNKWLLQTTGYHIQVNPLLTVPGWWVNVTGHGLVNVVNHKQVLAAVNGRQETFLTPDQVEKICRELELHCRDVEF